METIEPNSAPEIIDQRQIRLQAAIQSLATYEKGLLVMDPAEVRKARKLKAGATALAL